MSMNILFFQYLLRINFLSNQAAMVCAIVNGFIKWAPLRVSNFVISISLEFFNKSWASALFFDAPSETVFEIVDSYFPLFALILEYDDKIFITER